MAQTWDDLLDIKNLHRGWHLARLDAQNNSFIEEKYSIEAFASDLKSNLEEISRQIETHTYQPSALTKIDIPKNTLLVRPGSHMIIEDRVALHTIIYLIAEKTASDVPQNVYSLRLKKNYKEQRGNMFEAIEELPFLKKSTIHKKISKFESWYYLWPEFDEKSKEAYQKNGKKYLSVSDISAYFENIQIPILRDQMIAKLEKGEQKLVNLLISFLENWAIKTNDGRSQWRGIPQGNEICSFLGTIFLAEIDKHFVNFCENHDAEYHRYVDDVRIFTKVEKDAKLAIWLLEKELRQIHLNVQSGKTFILNRKDMEEYLEDKRMNRLNDIYESLRLSPPKNDLDYDDLIKQLWGLAKKEVKSP